MKRSGHTNGNPPPGTVIVTVRAAAPPSAVFSALTDPAITRQWFGELNHPLAPGVPARLDFGDGDFFTIDQVSIDPPRGVAYQWQFLGIMPVDRIRWTIEPTAGGSIVTVTDSDPARQPDWLDQLRDGWVDFTTRLVEFLESGHSTRYDWRRDFDGGIELPCSVATAARILTDPALATRWLPFDRGLATGARLLTDDGEEPSLVRVGSLTVEPNSVRFTLTSSAWDGPTECVLGVRSRGSAAMLTVLHNGWEGIDNQTDVQREQRRRFAAIWIAALTRARNVFSAEAHPPASLLATE